MTKKLIIFSFWERFRNWNCLFSKHYWTFNVDPSSVEKAVQLKRISRFFVKRPFFSAVLELFNMVSIQIQIIM